MKIIMSAIVYWLSVNFGLPASYDLPRIEYASADQLLELRHRGLAAPRAAKSGSLGAYRSVVALYDTSTKTIYLSDKWSGQTPAEISVLVHEMVHHLQNIGGLAFACPQEREQLAYAAQDRWLKLFGRDLERDFEIDGLTLLVTTSCM
jgi:hypothetical protein